VSFHRLFEPTGRVDDQVDRRYNRPSYPAAWGAPDEPRRSRARQVERVGGGLLRV